MLFPNVIPSCFYYYFIIIDNSRIFFHIENMILPFNVMVSIGRYIVLTRVSTYFQCFAVLGAVLPLIVPAGTSTHYYYSCITCSMEVIPQCVQAGVLATTCPFTFQSHLQLALSANDRDYGSWILVLREPHKQISVGETRVTLVANVKLIFACVSLDKCSMTNETSRSF
jgi:hypothetical protein